MSDRVLLWNEIALEANRVSHTIDQGEQAGPPLSARALAITHLAMYNAYVITKPGSGLQPYGSLPAAPSSGNENEAISAAAYTVLAQLYPSQEAYLNAMLISSGDVGLNSPSHKRGMDVAMALLADRAGDPKSGSTTYKPMTAPGRHRPDPDNPAQGFHAPDYGKGTPTFAATRRFMLAPPPSPERDTDPTYPAYLAALAQVRARGIKPELMGTLPPGGPSGLANARTPEETLIGLYWGYDGAVQLGTPPRLYNRIVREIAVAQGNSLAENARLFALVNVALADAGILAWQEKYRHELWRPVLGVREHDPSLGPAAPTPGSGLVPDCDTAWLPLGAPSTNRAGKNFTPNFPAYPSGHATFGAAALHMVRLFYGQGGRYRNTDNTDGTLTGDTLFSGSFISEECDGISRDNTGTVRPRHARTFAEGLWTMIQENGLSRVYLGVHWVFDAFMLDGAGNPDLHLMEGTDPYGGVPLGLLVAEDIFDAAGSNGPQRSYKSFVAPQAAAPQALRTETNSSEFRR